MSDAATAAQTAPAAQKSDDAKDAGSKSPASPVATTDGKTDADGASDDKTDATPAADADKKSTEGKYRFLCLKSFCHPIAPAPSQCKLSFNGSCSSRSAFFRDGRALV